MEELRTASASGLSESPIRAKICLTPMCSSTPTNVSATVWVMYSSDVLLAAIALVQGIVAAAGHDGLQHVKEQSPRPLLQKPRVPRGAREYIRSCLGAAANR